MLDVPLGSRFSLEMLNYTAVEKLSPGVYRLESETAGEEGNRYFGSLLPVDYISDLARGEIASLLILGRTLKRMMRYASVIWIQPDAQLLAEINITIWSGHCKFRVWEAHVFFHYGKVLKL